MDSNYFWLVLLALVLLSASQDSPISKAISWLGSLLGASSRLSWQISSLRSRSKTARIGRIERQLAKIEKIAQMQLSRTTNERRPQKTKHGKMIRDKCRARDVSYRLAIGMPRVNHREYATEIGLSYIKGASAPNKRKALIRAAAYAARIPDDQIIRVIETDGHRPEGERAKVVTTVRGRISKMKVGVPNIGLARIYWLSPDPEVKLAEAA